MVAGVPSGHPLHRLMAGLTERNFTMHLGWRDPEVVRYVADVLVDFVHVDRLWKIRDSRGRRVEEIAELLAEGDLLHRANSVERERLVHKHIGDYALFMTGLFPEYVRRLQARRSLISADAFLDYIQVGKRSYRIVSAHGEAAPAPAKLFRRLAENFELCVFGLGYVRADLDRMHNPQFRQIRGRLLG